MSWYVEVSCSLSNSFGMDELAITRGNAARGSFDHQHGCWLVPESHYNLATVYCNRGSADENAAKVRIRILH